DLELQLLAAHPVEDALARSLAPLPDRVEEHGRPRLDRRDLIEDMKLRCLGSEKLIPRVLVRLQPFGGSRRRSGRDLALQFRPSRQEQQDRDGRVPRHWPAKYIGLQFAHSRRSWHPDPSRRFSSPSPSWRRARRARAFPSSLGRNERSGFVSCPTERESGSKRLRGRSFSPMKRTSSFCSARSTSARSSRRGSGKAGGEAGSSIPCGRDTARAIWSCCT